MERLFRISCKAKIGQDTALHCPEPGISRDLVMKLLKKHRGDPLNDEYLWQHSSAIAVYNLIRGVSSVRGFHYHVRSCESKLKQPGRLSIRWPGTYGRESSSGPRLMIVARRSAVPNHKLLFVQATAKEG